MRDKWRADDHHRDDIHHRERGRRDRQERSPAASQRRRDPDAELKIRGTAKNDTVARSSRNLDSGRELSDRGAAARARSRSARGRSGADDTERYLGHQRALHQGRRDTRNDSDLSIRRRGSGSRSPGRDSYHYREERRRTRSPPYTARTDRGVSSRHPDRAFSPPPVSPRIDHYSSIQEDPATRALDSYIPGRRRRSRSPALRDEYRPAPPRRRSPSPERRYRPRERVPARRDDRSPFRTRERSLDRYSTRKEQVRAIEATHQVPRSREDSRDRHHSARPPRRRSPLPTQEEAKAEFTHRKRTRSPENLERPRDRRKEMYPSAHPARNLPDGSQNRGQVPMQQGYPMHDPSRRPQPVDTRATYSASPQWTPVTSHHVSPHSASPYSQAHVGWGGQQQSYQGQPGYVLALCP